jgi:TolB-like protein
MDPRGNKPSHPPGAPAPEPSFDTDAPTLERDAPPPVVPEAPPPKTIELPLSVLAVAASAVILIVIAVLFWEHSKRPAPAANGKIRLAVLPFRNLTGDPKQEYVSDGFAEEMISQLGRLNHDQLGVIARTSAMGYKNTHKPVRKIARELNVNYVLEGSVRNSPGGFRIATQLIRGSDEVQVWSEEYDRPIGDLMKLEEELAKNVADEIQVQLLPRNPADVRVARSVSRDAYVYYLQGRFAFNLRNGPNLFNAVSSFEQAIHQDPGFAAAYAGLADSYNVLMFYGYAPEDATLPKARDAATKAVAIDDSLAEGHASLGYIYFIWDWDWTEAEREFQRAIVLNRNYAPAHHWYALLLRR